VQRSLILALVASALVIVGCGSSKSAGAPASAVTTALSYLPADSPFVITTKTTPNPGG
jgi:ABC-type glycerol-3-phosphate transport system substrate-binding protein